MSPRGSVITVTFIDGEVKEFHISAGPGVGSYLAKQAGGTGVLSLFNNEQSWGIPLDRIRDWSIVAAPSDDALAATLQADPKESDK